MKKRHATWIGFALTGIILVCLFFLVRPETLEAPTTASHVVSTLATPEMALPTRIPADPSPPQVAGHPCTVTGLVLRPDGTPANGAEVGFRWRASQLQPPVENLNGEMAIEPVLTGQDGRFLIGNLPRGEVVVVARHTTGIAVEQIQLSSHRQHPDLTLILRGGLALAGRVVDRDRRGIGGARVMPVARDGAPYREYICEARAVNSSEDSSFRLEGLEPGNWTLHASAADFGPAITGPLAAGMEHVQIELSRGANLDCRVLRHGDGAPAANVPLTLTRADFQVPPDLASSDSNGAARFQDVGLGDYLLDIESKSHALVGPPVPVSVDPAHTPETVTLHVAEGGEIRGRLRDGKSGGGIAGIVLVARQSERSRRFFSTATDAGGEYTITGLPPGDFTVSLPLRIPGYPQDPLTPTDKSASVSVGKTVTGLDFELTAGAALGGIVLDAAGVPVEGAAVRANAAEGRMNLGEYYTAKDGRFIFGDYEEGESAYLVAETESAQSLRAGPFVAGAPGSDAIELHLDLECAGVIAGRVLDRRNRPFICKIGVTALDPSLKFPAVVRDGETDGHGNFVIAGVCPGSYRLTIIPRSNVRQESATVTLAPGQRLTGLTLVYEQGDFFDLHGVVVDGEGNPVPNARATAAHFDGQHFAPESTVVADALGEFSFVGLPEGDYRIGARADGYAGSENVIARAGDSGVVVQLIGAPAVSGRVTGTDGNPVTAYELILIPGDAQRSNLRRRVADEGGAYFATLPDGGVWTIRVEAPGYGSAELDAGYVTPGEHETGLDLVMSTSQ